MEAMKKKRNDCLAQLKELAADRRKRPTLDNLKSQIEGLRTRLLYTQREVDSNVRVTYFPFRSITCMDVLGAVYMVSLTRDTLPPETTLSRVYMIK